MAREQNGGGLSIQQVAARTGLTAHTLRYYERIGLMASIPRAPSGHRRYQPEHLNWVELLKKLHATGMPIRHMLAYARLVRRGDSTARERRLLLETHRREVLSRAEELQQCLARLENKIRIYERIEAREAQRSEGNPRTTEAG